MPDLVGDKEHCQKCKANQGPNHVTGAPGFSNTAPLHIEEDTDQSCDDCARADNIKVEENFPPCCVGGFGSIRRFEVK